MSGTSLDGLDLALCRISGSGLNTKLVVDFATTVPYPESFKAAIREVFAKEWVSLEKVTLLNAYIANQHADWVLQTLAEWGIKPKDVDAIASHGQTIYHAPFRLHQKAGFPNATLQIGDGDHLAVKTGILTVSDFRQKHLAAGGEGAPLAVYGDVILFSSNTENRVLLNLGGIANFSFLPKDGDTSKIISSDVGPANTLIDAAVRNHFQKDFDRDGAIAQSGKVDVELLNRLLEHPFFEEALPKSTGPEMFNLDWVNQEIQKLHIAISANDLVATLSRLSIEVIARSIRNHFTLPNTSMYVSGGGANNPCLMNGLRELLPEFNCRNLNELGVHSDAKEAVLFALLANETLAGEAFSIAGLPAISLGKISFPA